jgi:hypothetical protein
MNEIDRFVSEQLADLIASAETGEDWAEICRQEELLKQRWVEDNGQFGVGA